MSYYVCKGAKLKCSFGNNQSELNVLSENRQLTNGNKRANIEDFKPNVNIQSFGQCSSIANPSVASATSANFGALTPMPCIPNTSVTWSPGKANLYVEGKPALLNDDKLFCMYGGIIEVMEQKDTNITTGAEQLELEEIEKKPCCIVLFRPDKDYSGQYGFDWIRKSEEKIETINGLKGNDLDTEYLLGKYIVDNCKENRKECVNKKDCVPKYCLSWGGWSDVFEHDKEKLKDKGSMFRDLLSIFKPYRIFGFSDEYREPVLTIMPGSEFALTLLLKVFIKDKELEKDIEWEYDKDCLFVSELKSFSGSKINEWTDWKIDVECLKEFSKDQYVKVYYDGNLCGSLRILANDSSHHTKVNVLLVNVECRGESLELDEQEISTMNKFLKQGYVFINYEKTFLNLNGDSLFETLYIDVNKNGGEEGGLYRIKDDNGSLLIYLNHKIDAITKGKYKNYIKIYSFFQKFNGKARGWSYGKSIVLFGNRFDEALPHEILHSLNLPHTFSSKEARNVRIFPWPIDFKVPFTYMALKTDNIMDYCHRVDVKHLSSFYWQWKVINSKIS